METVKKFYETLTTDEAMRARASALSEKYQDAQPEAAAIAAEIAAFAKAEGFVFTADDLAAYAKTEGRELSDDQLAAVVGGVYNPSTCLCFMGGGGKDPETGRTCACVLGGGGKKDKDGNRLVCFGAGTVGSKG
jgi:predicted ribosomally synthesized peptide with nif11-like leader